MADLEGRAVGIAKGGCGMVINRVEEVVAAPIVEV